jgi:hypothetical protein
MYIIFTSKKILRSIVPSRKYLAILDNLEKLISLGKLLAGNIIYFS